MGHVEATQPNQVYRKIHPQESRQQNQSTNNQESGLRQNSRAQGNRCGCSCCASFFGMHFRTVGGPFPSTEV
eukprot:scaffold8628_cov149-Amphora_coffeaeformis.AAC.4